MVHDFSTAAERNPAPAFFAEARGINLRVFPAPAIRAIFRKTEPHTEEPFGNGFVKNGLIAIATATVFALVWVQLWISHGEALLVEVTSKKGEVLKAASGQYAPSATWWHRPLPDG